MPRFAIHSRIAEGKQTIRLYEDDLLIINSVSHTTEQAYKIAFRRAVDRLEQVSTTCRRIEEENEALRASLVALAKSIETPSRAPEPLPNTLDG